MGKITLTDEMGGVAHMTIADVKQSNGVIHVIDKVLCPRCSPGPFRHQKGQRHLRSPAFSVFVVERLPDYMFGRTAMSRTSLSSPVIGLTSLAAPVSRLTV